MRKKSAGLILVLVFAVAALAAERLKVKPGAEAPDYFEKNRSARLVYWEHPVYPAEPGADWVQRAVRVGFELDPAGGLVDVRVLGGAEEYRAAAVGAVSRWKFEPEIEDGQPVLVSKEVRLVFTPRGTPKRTSRDEFMPPYTIETPPETPAGEPVNPEALYPAALLPRRLSGEVEMILGIDREGRVEGVEILGAPHVEFLSAALRTVETWKLRPARKGKVPTAGQKRAVLSFHPVDEEGRLLRFEWLERNGIFLREPAGIKSTDHFDHTPEALAMADPVYPHALLLAGTAGGARVNFNVTPEGQVTNVRIDEATAPEFGESLAAAIAAWQFRPLSKEGKECWADFTMTWRFGAPAADSVERRLLDGRDTRKAVNPRQLDRPLAVLFVRQAVYPAALREAGEAGEAQIEVVVDREGRVRLPQIRSATKPEFGWAAATAVSQWLFETPRKEGEPVEVRVVIPVQFTVPPPAT
jgi:TonB family protein